MLKRHIFYLSLVLIAYVVGSSNRAYSENYRVITGFLPPWSMASNAEMQGFFIEIVKEALSRIDEKKNIETLPWSRALSLTENTKNIILFPVARLASREQKYNWLNQIKPMEMVFVSYNYKLLDELTAKDLKRILVHRNAPPEMVLKARNFKNLAPIYDVTKNLPQMLRIGRADAWFTPKDMAEWVWKLNPDHPLPYYSTPLTIDDLYIVTSHIFDNSIKNKLQHAIKEMHHDGSISKIIQKYTR